MSERYNTGANPPKVIVGFRFHPTDEELLVHYLDPKNGVGGLLVENVINEVKMCDHDPWELPGKAMIQSKEDREWYFFCKPEPKYPIRRKGKSPRGNRKPLTNRATRSGCWKSTGVDREIKENGKKIGIKKTLVFHERGQIKKGQRSTWVMHEYHSLNVPSHGTPYVVCKLMKNGDDASDIGETSHNNSPASPPQIPSQEVYQPAADQRIFDSEQVDLDEMFGEETVQLPAMDIPDGFNDQISASHFANYYDYIP